MKIVSLIKPAALILATTLTLSVAMPVISANAGGKNTAKVVAAGIIGLALGAVAVDASRHHRARRHNNYRPVYNPPAPSYSQTVVVTRRNHYQPTYRQPQYQPAPTVYHAPAAPQVITYDNAMVNAGPPEPWSNRWLSYCRATYRSFNSNSGTFMGYDGRRHFCEAK